MSGSVHYHAAAPSPSVVSFVSRSLNFTLQPKLEALVTRCGSSELLFRRNLTYFACPLVQALETGHRENSQLWPFKVQINDNHLVHEARFYA